MARCHGWLATLQSPHSPCRYQRAFHVDRVRFKDKKLFKGRVQASAPGGDQAALDVWQCHPARHPLHLPLARVRHSSSCFRCPPCDVQVQGGPGGDACTLQFGVCSVRDEEGRHHVELRGSCLELDALLSGKAKAADVDASAGSEGSNAGAAAAPPAAAIVPYIRAMQAACQRLCTAA